MGYRLNDEYPSDFEAKQLIIEIGKRMYLKNFVASNDGNISVKVSDHTVWCTPTGVSKGYMTDDMLVLMDIDGTVLRGNRKPSSEMKMHLRVYNENPDLKAVVHAHPPAATSYAIAGLPLNQAILTEAVMGIGEIPLAPYAMPGTHEVPDSIAPFVKTHNGCLLANHGALAWGKTAMEAWMRMESIEYYAMVSMYTRGLIGQVNELTCSQVDRLIERRTNDGIMTGGRPTCRDCTASSESACKTCSCGGNHDHKSSAASMSAEDQKDVQMITDIVRQIIAGMK